LSLFFIGNLGQNGGIVWLVLSFTFTIPATIFCFRLGASLGFNKGLKAVLFTILISLFLYAIMTQLLFYSLPYKLEIFTTIILISASFIIIGNLFGFLLKEHKKVGFSQKSAVQISLLATVVGSTLYVGLLLGLSNPLAMLAFVIFEVVGTGLLLGIESRERKKLIDEYRQSEPHRIKP
jgi:hypothetical protein